MALQVSEKSGNVEHGPLNLAEKNEFPVPMIRKWAFGGDHLFARKAAGCRACPFHLPLYLPFAAGFHGGFRAKFVSVPGLQKCRLSLEMV